MLLLVPHHHREESPKPSPIRTGQHTLSLPSLVLATSMQAASYLCPLYSDFISLILSWGRYGRGTGPVALPLIVQFLTHPQFVAPE